MANIVVYQDFVGEIHGGGIDWESDTIKVALLTDSYSPDQETDTHFDDVDTDEVSSGDGYTSGGETISNASSSADDLVHTLDGDDVSWTESTITARYGVIYKDTGTASTSPLVAYIDFEENKSSSDGTFQIAWGSDGIITYTLVAA